MIQLKHDFTKLNKFVKSMTENYVVRVGIFSDRTGRTDTGDTDNATIGLTHELGSFERHIPVRSWLKMPIQVSQSEIIKEGSYGMVDLMAAGHMERVLKEFGFACEEAVLAAFKSGGFGTWESLKDPNAHHAILIDTGQLRRAVASQVVKK